MSYWNVVFFKLNSNSFCVFFNHIHSSSYLATIAEYTKLCYCSFITNVNLDDKHPVDVDWTINYLNHIEIADVLQRIMN